MGWSEQALPSSLVSARSSQCDLEQALSHSEPQFRPLSSGDHHIRWQVVVRMQEEDRWQTQGVETLGWEQCQPQPTKVVEEFLLQPEGPGPGSCKVLLAAEAPPVLVAMVPEEAEDPFLAMGCHGFTRTWCCTSG